MIANGVRKKTVLSKVVNFDYDQCIKIHNPHVLAETNQMITWACVTLKFLTVFTAVKPHYDWRLKSST